MMKIKQIVVTFIFGQTATPVEQFYPGVRTYNEMKNRPSFNKWCKMYNVSRLHKR